MGFSRIFSYFLLFFFIFIFFVFLFFFLFFCFVCVVVAGGRCRLSVVCASHSTLRVPASPPRFVLRENKKTRIFVCFFFFFFFSFGGFLCFLTWLSLCFVDSLNWFFFLFLVFCSEIS